MTIGHTVEMVAKAHAGLPGRRAAYRLPRPTPGVTLQHIAQRFEDCLDLTEVGSIHVIGVATGGDQIAAAVSTHFTYRHPGLPVWVSTINLAKKLNIVSSLESVSGRRPRTVVVDNAITTGQTMHEVLKLLAGKGIAVDVVVKLVDYQDDLERGARRYLDLEHGVPIVSLFTVKDLTAVVDPV